MGAREGQPLYLRGQSHNFHGICNVSFEKVSREMSDKLWGAGHVVLTLRNKAFFKNHMG